MYGFWDVAPKPPLLSYLRTSIFGASNLDTAQPPVRLAGNSPPLSLPAGVQPWVHLPIEAIHEFCDFLRRYFVSAKSGQGPIYVIDPLTVKNDIENNSGYRPLIVRSDETGHIIGCVSSAPIGRLQRNGSQAPTPFNLRIIRDFCVHPAYRGKGVGSYLLFSVWEDARSIGEDAVIFLKEGPSISRAGPTLMSSPWIYRRMREAEDVSKVQRVPWNALTHELKIFTAGRRDILFNIPGKIPRDSVALIYRTYRGAILAAFTRAHQQHPDDGEMICFETGWLEHGELLDGEKRDATLQLSAAAAAILDCYWVWSKCDGKKIWDTPWKLDGQFHWYAFNWSPGFYGNVNLWLVF
jgi:GNAT superfamily N-acetyltransferase